MMMGVPNEGAAGPWQPINDEFQTDSDAIDIATAVVIRDLFNDAYQYILRNPDNTIAGPDMNINLASISVGGVPSQTLFIQQYCPTLQELLATYDFIEVSPNQYVPPPGDQQNAFLMALNAGQNNPATSFANQVNMLYDIYGNDTNTPTYVTSYVGAYIPLDLTPSVGTIYPFLMGPGDETVPSFSAAPNGKPGTDTNINFANFPTKIKLQDQYGITHTGMFSVPSIEQLALNDLGDQISLSNISTTLGGNNYSYVLTVVLDPVQGFLVDANGNRLGYSTATGAVTQIPGSQWYGGEEGFGIINGSVALPLTLQLIGVGADYYASVDGYQGNMTVSVQSSGDLASGAQQTVALPFQVIPAPS